MLYCIFSSNLTIWGRYPLLELSVFLFFIVNKYSPLRQCVHSAIANGLTKIDRWIRKNFGSGNSCVNCFRVFLILKEEVFIEAAQLAEETTWWFAAGIFIVIAIVMTLLVYFVFAMDGAFQRFFDWIGGVKYPGGIKPAKNPAPEPKRHWFIRFGWMPALVIGAAAVYVLPEEVLAWL